MENKEMTPQEWEISVKEKLAGIDEEKLLDLAQHCAITLAAKLGSARALCGDEEYTAEEIEDKICSSIGRMAVMLDILQLRYCDCADEELEYLMNIEACFEE